MCWSRRSRDDERASPRGSAPVHGQNGRFDGQRGGLTHAAVCAPIPNPPKVDDMIVLKATQDKVLAVLQSVSGIVERRHTLPILANVLLRKTGNAIQLTTSDLEIP